MSPVDGSSPPSLTCAGGLPLRYRLPNAPKELIGRQRELDWILASLESAPVTVLWGIGGIGKSAIAWTALHRWDRDVRQVLRVAVEGNAGEAVDGLGLRLHLARALAALSPIDVHWESLATDVAGLGALIIDLADEGELCVLLEDLHHAPNDDAWSLIEQFARYAKRARWLVTSRTRPPSTDLLGSTLEVRGLALEHLLSLALRWAPERSEDDLAEVARRSAGSPWLLAQSLVHGPAVIDVYAAELFTQMTTTGQRFVQALSLVGGTLDEATMRSIVATPTDAERADLCRRGVVERTPGGFRIHDVARELVLDRMGEAQKRRLREDLAQALEASTTIDEQVCAIGLRLANGDIIRARAMIEGRYEALQRDGRLPEVWRSLCIHEDEELAKLRLRVAADLGTPDAVGRVVLPSRPDARDRVRWACVLSYRGELEDAVAVLDEVQAILAHSQDRALRFEAGLTRARFLGDLGQFDEALLALEATEPSTPDEALLLDGLRFSVLARLNRTREAEEKIESLQLRVANATGDVKRRVQRHLCSGLGSLGRMRDVVAVLEQWNDAYDHHGRQRIFWLSSVSVATGPLTTAIELSRRLVRIEGEVGAFGPYALANEILGRVHAGEMDGIDALIDHATRVARSSGNAQAEAELICLRMELDELRAAPASAPPLLPASCPPSAHSEAALLHRRRLARWSRTPLGDRVECGTRTHHVLAAMNDALLAIASGEANREETVALSSAIAMADATGHVSNACKAREVRIDAAVVAGEDPNDVIDSLDAAAEELGSTRFASVAALARAVTSRPVPVEVLERCAATPDVCPRSSRRARLLLGHEVRHDHVDARWVAAVTAARGWPEIETVGGSDDDGWQVAWGVDEPRGTVWHPDGTTVSLANHGTLLRVLITLLECGGAASKEVLVERVWGEREYHPIRHDNRLRVTVRKLRARLEPSSETSTRVLTDEDGYRLATPVRWLRCHTA